MRINKKQILAVVGSLVLICASQFSHAADVKSRLITESYYTDKWGHFDEFVDLFKKNHYPILKEMQELGHIESLVIEYPLNHAGEAG